MISENLVAAGRKETSAVNDDEPRPKRSRKK